MMPLEDNAKLLMITGAAGALGSELALLCALAGWETVLLDKDKRGLNRLYDFIVEEGGVEPTIVVLDLAVMGQEQAIQVTKALHSRSDRLDALVHCAVHFEGLQPLDQIKPQDWLHQMQVNLNAPWLLSVSCLPMLRQSQQSSLLFISEDDKKTSAAFWGAYGVSKSGVRTLAGQLAAEVGNGDIQVLSVNPGPMRSPLRAKVYHSENPQDIDHPKVAAGKILQLLNRKLKPASFHINLEDLTE